MMLGHVLALPRRYPDAIAATQNAQTSTQNAQLAFTPTDTLIKDCDVSSVFHEDWTTVFCDTFNDNLNNWIWVAVDELSRSLFQIEDGKFVADLTVRSPRVPIRCNSMDEYPTPRNFVITIKGDIFSNYKSCSWELFSISAIE
jgi:hypothetical protein